MSHGQLVPEAHAPGEIKQVPQEAAVREKIRTAAADIMHGRPRASAPGRDLLAELGAELLQRLELPPTCLGFTMVALSNAFWREQYEAVPLHRRLLLLPKCLRDPVACRGTFDSVGLNCAGCGACVIGDLVAKAQTLGYSVIVAEGTSSVIMKVLEGEADAILGVACLDSLDESFEPIADLGVPNQAIPLLRDGCERTETEPALIAQLMTVMQSSAIQTTRTSVPLLRATREIFAASSLATLLGLHVSDGAFASGAADEPLLQTEALGLDWLVCGGKRLRPFVTVAAYALGRHGVRSLEPRANAGEMLDEPVQALAVAIEALHKASLIHDDIADGDEFRYGRRTLHASHGTGIAINVGDWLVGLGYRLAGDQAEAFGGDRAAEIATRLAKAQLALCKGQGAELAWIGSESRALRAADALAIGALKTAPAFEVALHAGLIASGAHYERDVVARFATYLGEAYQVLNDLEDWRDDAGNKVSVGLDVLSRRPTILRAFATEAGGWEQLARLREESDPQAIVASVRRLYDETGAFEKTRALLGGLRNRCLTLAEGMRPEALGDLLRFLTRTVLRERGEPRTREV